VAIQGGRIISICQPIERGAGAGGNVTGIETPSGLDAGIEREREAVQGRGSVQRFPLFSTFPWEEDLGTWWCISPAMGIRHPSGGIDIGGTVDGAESLPLPDAGVAILHRAPSRFPCHIYRPVHGTSLFSI
jgi:hypothetical protein